MSSTSDQYWRYSTFTCSLQSWLALFYRKVQLFPIPHCCTSIQCECRMKRACCSSCCMLTFTICDHIFNFLKQWTWRSVISQTRWVSLCDLSAVYVWLRLSTRTISDDCYLALCQVNCLSQHACHLSITPSFHLFFYLSNFFLPLRLSETDNILMHCSSSDQIRTVALVWISKHRLTGSYSDQSMVYHCSLSTDKIDESQKLILQWI